jgi:hypothetical protein
MTEMAERCEGVIELRERLEAVELELQMDALLLEEVLSYMKDVTGTLKVRIYARHKFLTELKKEKV